MPDLNPCRSAWSHLVVGFAFALAACGDAGESALFQPAEKFICDLETSECGLAPIELGAPCEESSRCESGICHSATGTCVAGDPGDTCYEPGDCANGLCNTLQKCGQLDDGMNCGAHGDCKSDLCNSLGQCGQVDVGQACSQAQDCLGGICNSKGTCGTLSDGAACTQDADCTTGMCNGVGTCGQLDLDQPCAENVDCASQMCAQGVCSDGALGDPCDDSDDCQSGSCLFGACVEGGTQGLGEPCSEAENCLTNYCSGLDEVCTEGETGAPCDDANEDNDAGECQSGLCGSEDTCVAGLAGDPCSADGDCGDELTCAGPPAQETCSSKMLGMPCAGVDSGANENDCVEGYCYEHACQAGTNGQACLGPGDCAHGCVDEACTDGELGQACDPNNPCVEAADGQEVVCNLDVCMAGASLLLGEACDIPKACNSGYCSLSDNACSTGEAGAPCKASGGLDSWECVSGICLDSGVCTDGKNGDACTSDDDCYASNCVDAGICSDGTLGAHCDSSADCDGTLICEGLGSAGTCTDYTLGQSCDASPSWDNPNDCVEGYCYEGVCQAGTNGQPCNETNYSDSYAHKDCKYKCIDFVCTEGLPGNACTASIPCISSAGNPMTCVAGSCATGCEDSQDCPEGQYCQIGSSGDGLCTSGDVGSPCAGDNHCGPGLDCLGLGNVTKWTSTDGENLCTDNQLGSPCNHSSCAGDAVCVGDQTPTSATVAGVCIEPGFASPCQLVLEDTSSCSTAAGDHAMGRNDCGGDLWIPGIDFQSATLGGGANDPMSKKRPLVCVPAPGCDMLDATNPMCDGYCLFGPPGEQCLPFDEEASASCGNGSYFDYWGGYSAFGCEEDLYCVDGLCTVGAAGDPCEPGECLAGLKCFAGVCVADSCTPDCEGMACGDDGCGGTCGSCGTYQNCTIDACTDDVTIVVQTPSYGFGVSNPSAVVTVEVGAPWHESWVLEVPKNANWLYTLTGSASYPGTYTVTVDHNFSSSVQTFVYACGLLVQENEQGAPFEVMDCATIGCTPKCIGKSCGGDGCGGSCGACAGGDVCSQEGQCEPCAPACADKACGDDGCGGSCGACGPGEACGDAGQCGCVPQCEGKQCGDDGCGASCGDCGANGACSDAFTCECVPDCADKTCGDDGCNGTCGSCDDGDLCTTDACEDAACVFSADVECDDDNPCTEDVCDAIAGCVNTPLSSPDASCDDGQVCNGVETCSAGVCLSGAAPECSSDDPCLTSDCDEDTGGCVDSPTTGPCDDGDTCTQGTVCSGGLCSGGQSVDCDDGVACTNDTCEPNVGCTYEEADFTAQDCSSYPVCDEASNLGTLQHDIAVELNYSWVPANLGGGTCGNTGSNSYCDDCLQKALRFTLSEDAELKISYTVPGSSHVFIRADCDDVTSDVFCKNPGYSGSHWSFSEDLAAGTYTIHIAASGEPTTSEIYSSSIKALYSGEPGGGGGSHPCDDSCGAQAPSGCWCDATCKDYGDCCDAAGSANSSSCAGSTCSTCQ